MEKWDRINAKVRKLEEELETIEEQYRKDKKAIEEDFALYEDRQRQLYLLLETKHEEALYDFRRAEIEDYQELNNLFEACLLISQNTFSKAFQECDDRMDTLE
ncbi:hypothetical protein ACVR0S_03500 [Streptococcus dentapri]|uniref:Uncharacterized protein n=1 Tax=Streptococcus dentapri TaxID=573564 RepID=A0ABV8D2K0_9STRE